MRMQMDLGTRERLAKAFRMYTDRCTEAVDQMAPMLRLVGTSEEDVNARLKQARDWTRRVGELLESGAMEGLSPALLVTVTAGYMNGLDGALQAARKESAQRGK